jgi:AraC-like DNA-binding protein
MQMTITHLPFFDGLELKEATFQKKSFPTHYHDTYSIGIIKQGFEKIEVEGKKMTAHAQSIVIINPYQLHANAFFDEDAWTYQCVFINEDVLKYVVGKTSNSPIFPTQIMDNEAMVKQLASCFGQARQDIDCWKNTLASLVTQYASPLCEKENSLTENQVMQEATLYLCQNACKPLELEQVAQKFHLSKGQFIRNFKKHTGLTPISFLLMHRIEEAKKRIKQGYTLTEVSLAVGFYDQAHFIKYFQKYMGVSPFRYRQGLE